MSPAARAPVPLARLAPRLVAIALLVAAGAVVAQHVRFSCAVRFRPPFWDEWNLLRLYWDTSPASFLAFHNEHRIVVPRLLFYLDQRFFQFSGIFVWTCTWLAAGSIAVLCARRHGESPGAPWVARVALSGVLFLSGFHAENFAWGMSIGNVLAVAFALAGLSLAAGLPASSSPRDVPRCLAILLFGILASASGLQGLVFWPALLLTATIVRRSAGLVWTVTLPVAAALGALYFRHFPTPHARVFEPIATARFFVHCVGLPFTAFGEVAAYAGGALVSGLALLMLGMHIVQRPATPRDRFFVSALLFTGLALGLVAYGRHGELLDLETSYFGSRYLLLVGVLWVSTLALGTPATPAAGSDTTARPAWTTLPSLAYYPLVGVAILGAYTAQRATMRGIRDRYLENEVAVTALLTGVPDDALNAYSIWRDPPAALKVSEDVLRPQQAGPFSRREAGWVRTHLTGLALDVRRACDGGLERAEPRTAGDLSWWAVGGWVEPRMRGRAPRVLLLVDTQGVARGIAYPVSAEAERVHWSGFVRDVASPSGLVVLAVDDDLDDACWFRPPPESALTDVTREHREPR